MKDSENAFQNIQHHFMIKILNKVGNIIKARYAKPRVKITPSSEKLKDFFLRLGKMEGCPLSPLLQMVFEFLAITIRRENEIKASKTEREEVTLIICILHPY